MSSTLLWFKTAVGGADFARPAVKRITPRQAWGLTIIWNSQIIFFATDVSDFSTNPGEVWTKGWRESVLFVKCVI